MSAVSEVGLAAERGFGSLLDRLIERLGSLRAMTGFWTAYVVIHCALRLGRSSYLFVDDTLSTEVMQGRLLPAYSARNPPLYEWLLWLVQQVLGHGIAGHIVLRSVLIVAIGVAMFDTVRALSGDRRLAVTASLSLLSFYWFGWHVHVALTQSLVLVLIVLLLMRALDAFCCRPDLARAVALGCAMAFGILSKWNFVLAAGAAFAAVGMDPTLRRRVGVLPLIVVAVALIVLTPTIFYMLAINADVVGVSMDNLTNGRASHIMRATEGLIRLLAVTVLFLLPWLFLVAYPFWRWRMWREWKVATENEALILRMGLAGVLMCAAAIVAVGIVNINERYVYPLGLPLIVGFYLAAGRGEAAPSFRRVVTSGSLVLAVLVLVIKLGFVLETFRPDGKTSQETMPYPALVQELTTRGLDDAAFVTPIHRLAAHIIEFMPQASAISTSTSRLTRPNTYDSVRDCVLIWSEKDSGANMPKDFLRSGLLPRDVSQAERLDIVGSSGGLGAPRRGVWYMIDLGKDAPLCQAELGMRGRK